MPDLSRILALLDDGETTEVVLASGQPITIRRGGSYMRTGPALLTVDHILALADETALAPMVLRGEGDTATISLLGRPYRAEVSRFGERLVIRLSLASSTRTLAMPTVVERQRTPAAAPAPTPPPTPVGPPPAAPPSQGGITFKKPEGRQRSQHQPPPPIELPRSQSVDIEIDLSPSGGTTPPQSTRPAPPRDAAPARTPSIDIELELEPPKRPAKITLAPAPPRRTTIAPPISTQPLPPLKQPPPAAAFPEFIELVEEAKRRRATDLHVVVGEPTMIRTAEGLAPFGERLGPDDVDALLVPLMTIAQRSQLDQRGYVDTAIDLGPVARLRANLSRTRTGLKGSFRLVMTTPPTLEQLGLPPELAKVTTYHQGLVLIAGPNGHGKTTTLGALVDLINRTKPHHILTVEDPVEIIHPRKAAVISQREVGTHTKSFATALKASLREDPDVIVIGELRDRETVEIALTAAETGHLVMATTSTPSAAKTLDRLIDMFPPADQSQVRASLAAALRFVVAQRLVPGTAGGPVAAVELVTGVLPLATMIRDDKLFQLPSLLQRGRAFGMIRLDDSLAEHVRAGRISQDVALRTAESRRDLEIALRGKPELAATQPIKRGMFGLGPSGKDKP